MKTSTRHIFVGTSAYLVTIWLALATSTSFAVTPEEALDDSWVKVCPGAAPGSSFAARCGEILNAGPGSGDRQSEAATGNNLNNVSAQGRVGTLGSDDDNDNRDGDSLKLESDFGRWSLHLNGKYSSLEKDTTRFESGYDTDGYTFSGGADYRLNNNWTMGAFAVFGSSDTKFDGKTGKQDTDSWSVNGVVTGMLSEHIYLTAYVGGGTVDYDNERNINYTLLLDAGLPTETTTTVTSVATSKTDADQIFAGFELGYQVTRGSTILGASAGYDYVDTDIAAYSESGGDGMAQSFDSQNITSQLWSLGLDLSQNVSKTWGILVPYVRVRYYIEADNNSRDLVSRFVGDTSGTDIVYATEDPDDFGTAAAGFSVLTVGGTSFYAEYEQMFAHDYFNQRTVSVGVRIEL